MEKSININDMVKVRLTNQGIEQLAKFNAYRNGFNYFFDEKGALNIRFHELMQIFGSGILGSAYFEDGVIRMDEEDLKDYDTNSKKM